MFQKPGKHHLPPLLFLLTPRSRPQPLRPLRKLDAPTPSFDVCIAHDACNTSNFRPYYKPHSHKSLPAASLRFVLSRLSPQSPLDHSPQSAPRLSHNTNVSRFLAPSVTKKLKMQFQIPCFPISYRTTFAELPEVFDIFISSAEEQNGSCPPFLIFEPHPEWPSYGPLPVISDAPEELIVAAWMPSIREACFQALERFEVREPEYPNHPTSKRRLKFKENTPIKSFFRQMTEMPATVFSLTFPDDGPDSISIFFLRTPFTVSEFRREIAQPI